MPTNPPIRAVDERHRITLGPRIATPGTLYRIVVNTDGIITLTPVVIQDA